MKAKRPAPKKQVNKQPKSKDPIVLLAAGLGNPGAHYAATRHNVGFRALGHFGVKLRRPLFNRFEYGVYPHAGGSVGLLRPLTYMNRSGEAVQRVIRLSGLESKQLVVLCDNIDLEPGVIRLKRGGSSAGHKGLKSIIAALGSEDFARIYIGIGRPEHAASVVEHVLGVPDASEAAQINDACRRAAQAVLRLAECELSQVMNEFNVRS